MRKLTGALLVWVGVVLLTAGLSQANVLLLGVGKKPAAGVVNVSDDFNRANGALGSNWTDAVGSNVIDTNRVTANGFNAAHNVSHWATAVNTFQNNQFSEATFTTAGDSGGLVVRWASTSGYKFVGPAGGNYFLYETTSGTDTSLGSFSSATIANADVVRLEATGTTIRVLVNTVEQLSVTDATHASGSPGLAMNWNGGAFLDNWSGGPVNFLLDPANDNTPMFLQKVA